jgi:orotate phosphoribosyltransferase
VAVLIALDRMERGQGEASAVQELQARFGVPVVAIATLDDLMAFIGGREELKAHAPRVAAYRAQYGVAAV